MEPLGQRFLDRGVTEELTLGLLGIILRYRLADGVEVVGDDGIIADHRSATVERRKHIRVERAIWRQAAHEFEREHRLTHVVAIEAVDDAGRGAGPIEQHLQANDRRIGMAFDGERRVCLLDRRRIDGGDGRKVRRVDGLGGERQGRRRHCLLCGGCSGNEGESEGYEREAHGFQFL